MERAESRRGAAVRAGWDVIIDPDEEYHRRVFSVSDDQLHAFVRALVAAGAEDFRVVRERGVGPDPFDSEPPGSPWPDVGDELVSL